MVEKDPDQHRSYAKLAEWLRRTLFLACVKKMKAAGKECPRYPGFIDTLTSKLVFFHLVCLEGRLKVHDESSNTAFVVPEKLAGDTYGRARTFWRHLDDIEGTIYCIPKSRINSSNISMIEAGRTVIPI